MTRSHRRRHVVMWAVLAPLIVALLALAIHARGERAAALSERSTAEAGS